ncbi:hypothetical protein SISSUDRAFT_1131926 [Sistotremastrum suecicum HHB10207 ss-3]|uniref:F-box domain-containing protein n=1 Tax=Sistotremastrum suecicum HHB10207 ss-3 TaxID=1314776 RepID=A0A165ZI11_9AGAM|nr:hypothetical protein SISSUDRAFT_1131926 [Sistotremastrum suecicum HHB10207 ss-3]
MEHSPRDEELTLNEYIDLVLRNFEVPADHLEADELRKDLQTIDEAKHSFLGALRSLKKQCRPREPTGPVSSDECGMPNASSTDALLTKSSDGDVVLSSHHSPVDNFELRRRLNSQLIIMRLPIEILQMIFKWTAAALWEHYYGHRAKLICGLTQTCSHWRKIALDTRQLWSRMSLNWSREFVSLFTTRAGKSSLDVEIRPHTIKSFQGLSEDLQQRVGMIRDLELALFASNVPAGHVSTLCEKMVISKAPRLETLRMSFEPYRQRDAKLVFRPFQDAPNIKKISLYGTAMSNLRDSVNLSALTSLSLMKVCAPDGALNLSDLVHFLSHAPNLEHLSLSQTFISKQTRPRVYTQLLKCTNIDLENHNRDITPYEFLDAIRCPNLQHLDVSSRVSEWWGKERPFGQYDTLPPYIRELIAHSEMIHINGGFPNVSVAYYPSSIFENRFSQSRYSFGTYDYAADVRKAESIIHSALSDMPLIDAVTLVLEKLDTIEKEAPATADDWKTLFRAYPSVTNLILREMGRTSNLFDALMDNSIFPLLKKVDVIGPTFNIRLIKEAFMARKSMGLTLSHLRLKQRTYDERNNAELRQIKTQCAEECFTNSDALEEI